MFPFDILFDITLYDILIGAGVLISLLVFRRYADRLNLRAKLQNLVLFCSLAAVVVGYGCAVLMQSVYHWIDTGKFEVTGATFYGGLLGGAAVFLLVYFIGGRYVYRGTAVPDYTRRKFFRMADIAACSITVAHGFGRLGCLMAGCCYGIVSETKTWYTFSFKLINDQNQVVGHRYALPTQLLEALFLFALFGWLSRRVLRGKTYNLQLYMGSYGVWRFLIEFLRADYRGKTIVPFLTPSQLIAILLIAGGVVLYYVEKKYGEKHPEALCDDPVPGEERLKQAAAVIQKEAEEGKDGNADV